MTRCTSKTASGKPCRNHAKAGLGLCGTHDKSTPTGRPTCYTLKHPMYAATMCRLGATDADLAEAFGVTVKTIHEWKHDYPDFCDALGESKPTANAEVGASLFKRAIGYEYDETRVREKHVTIKLEDGTLMPVTDDAGRPLIEQEVTITTKHALPSEAAIAIWLYNRDRQNWRDSRRIEHTGDGGGPIEVERREVAQMPSEKLREIVGGKVA